MGNICEKRLPDVQQNASSPDVTAPAAENLLASLKSKADEHAKADVTAPAASPKSKADEHAKAVQVGDSSATVTAEDGIDVCKALEAKPFKDWIDTISREKRIQVSQIHIQSIDMFGPTKVGFIKFKADAKVDGKQVPGIVFMRGGAVAILVILEHEDREFTLLVKQPRVPVCSGSFAEIPAGMLDGDGNFDGVAAKEMKEETTIEIKQDDLIDMTHLAFEDKFPGMFPSCGGSDEFNRIFLYRKRIDAEEFQDLQGKLTGVIEEGEIIKLQIIPLQELWRTSPDAKALAALCLYKKLGDSGRLPKVMPPPPSP